MVLGPGSHRPCIDAWDDTCKDMLVMAHIVMTYMVMAYMVVAYMVMAYMVTAYIVMAYIVIAYIVMAYIVMACILSRFWKVPRLEATWPHMQVGGV